MIENQISSFFPPAVKTVGYVTLVAGLLFLVFNPVMGIALAVIGFVIAFLRNGVEIDVASQRFREYTGLFQLKFGSWESMETFTDIAVLKKRIKTTAFSRANRPATTSDEVVNDICLLDKTHRLKRVIQRLENLDTATSQAKELSELLAVTYGPYSPEVSAETRARRR